MATNNNPSSPPAGLRYTRRGGSGFTLFVFGGVPIAFAQQISHQSPRFVNNPSFIQPMDEPYPVEILTPVAAGVGTIVLNLYDLWGNNRTDGSKVWDRLGNLPTSDKKNTIPDLTKGIPNLEAGNGYTSLAAGGIFGTASDIVDIAIIQAQAKPEQMTIVQYVRQIPGQGSGANTNSAPATTEGNWYYQQYHGCTIVDVRDDETIQVGTLEVIKQITINYTYSSRSKANSNYALNLRNNAH